ALRVDQGGVAGVATDPRLHRGVENRQQLLEAPDVLGAPVARDLLETACGELVVVLDIQTLAAVRTGEHPRLIEREALFAAVAGQADGARARPLTGSVGPAVCGCRAHAGTRNDTPGHGVCAPSWS